MNTTEMAFIVAAPQAPRIWCQTAVTTPAPVQTAHQVGVTRRYPGAGGGRRGACLAAFRRMGRREVSPSPPASPARAETSSRTGEDGALGRRGDPLGMKGVERGSDGILDLVTFTRG